MTASELLPLVDFAGMLFAAYGSQWASSMQFAPTGSLAGTWIELDRLIWVAAILAPFILYVPRFADRAAAADTSGLLRAFTRRFLALSGVAAAFAFAGRWIEQLPGAWLGLWLASSLFAAASVRIALAVALRRLALRGAWAGPITEIDPLVGDVLSVKLIVDRPIRRWNAVVKSGSDFLLGWIGTLVILPALALIAIAIRLDSAGPVLFTQRRHGYNNCEFDIFKFRTMHVATDEPGVAMQQTLRGDARVTRVGRFLRRWSLDELPQVFNVLAGDMSLVGPRPHAVDMRTEQQYGHEITECYPHRHRVRPGMTGWAQINGSRGATDTVDKLKRRVELDLYYVDHWSPLFDLKILAKTYKAVLQTANAF
ncbi:MAG: sugar transferase [Pseudomonadota bacterium]|nr:sugar transferase [Pseudomonadota bacterium]